MTTAAPPISPSGYAPRGDIWRSVRDSAAWRGRNRPALFLDRDGVINVDSGYVHRLDDLRMIPGAAGLVRAANERDIAVIVVTNQSGIGRGYYDWNDFTAFQTEIERHLAIEDARFDAAFACPFHREATPPYDVDGHPMRKPGPGMLLSGREELDVDLSTSWIVGDRPGDILAGAAAGIAGGILIGEELPAGLPAGFHGETVTSTADAMARIPLLND